MLLFLLFLLPPQQLVEPFVLRLERSDAAYVFPPPDEAPGSPPRDQRGERPEDDEQEQNSHGLVVVPPGLTVAACGRNDGHVVPVQMITEAFGESLSIASSCRI